MIIRAITENNNVWNHACRNTSLSISMRKDITDFWKTSQFIDKTDPSEPLKRENYWKNVLKTVTPLGLNIEDSV